MAFRVRLLSGLIGANFVPKRSWSCIHNCCIHNQRKLVLLHSVGRYRSPASVNRLRRSFGTVQWILTSNTSEWLSRKHAKVLLQFARPMCQFPRGDADAERMQQVLERSSQPPRTGAEGSRLIYQIRGLGMMRFCTLFFYITSLTGLYVAPDLISTALEHDSFNSEMILNFSTIIMAVGVLPILLTMFNRRLVLRLYYSDVNKSYVAMTQSPILTLRQMEFGQEDVIPNKNTGAILGVLNLNTLKARGRPYYVNPYNFTIPSDYNQLMGYV